MKKINIFYWIVTGLGSAFIALGAVMDVLKVPEAVALIKHLGYPEYFVPFIGIMKLLGIIAILQPRFSRLKEWAYAGLVFDISGALFSHISSGDGLNIWMPALISLILVAVSYVLHTKRTNTKQQRPIIA